VAKGVLVVSYDLPEDVDEGYAKLQFIADEVRPSFANKPDVEVRIAVREAADAILNVFAEGI
jgi:hypothetical protein